MPDPTQSELMTDAVTRLIAAQDQLTYFGSNSVGYAFAKTSAEQAGLSIAQYRSVLRRRTLFGSKGDDCTQAALERGVPRLDAARARVLVIFRPWYEVVQDIVVGRIAVTDSSRFAVGDTLRIRNSTGTKTEIATIYAITIGTSSGGFDEIDVGSLVQSYDPTVEDVAILLRTTITARTAVKSTTGVNFETLADVTIGDLNALLNGESASLALADKVWCECTTPGAAGNVDANSVTSFVVANPDVKSLTNPERGRGGDASEDDGSLKYRSAQAGQLSAVETPSAVETLAQAGNSEVLRAFLIDNEDAINAMSVLVLTRNMAGLDGDSLDALGAFLGARMRSRITVTCTNVAPTAVEVYADVTLTPGLTTVTARLLTAWRSAADAMVAYLDPRTWTEGDTVDEAKLLAIVSDTAGIASVQTSSFLPASDVLVDRVPVLVNLILRDVATGLFVGTDLTVEF